MPTDESTDLVRYLIETSRAGLGEFSLARMNRAANGEKQLRELLHQVVQDLAWVMVADLLREHGEEIAVVLGAPRRRRPRA